MAVVVSVLLFAAAFFASGAKLRRGARERTIGSDRIGKYVEISRDEIDDIHDGTILVGTNELDEPVVVRATLVSGGRVYFKPVGGLIGYALRSVLRVLKMARVLP